MNIVVLSEKEWHYPLVEDLKKELAGYKVFHCTEKDQFTREWLAPINPQYVFIPHWSYIIPKSIYENFECVVFHMTDLPYGRGGSPLQNLIVRGATETKISALRVNEGIDTGPIYLKKDLSLEGTATAIFERSVPVIKEMILQICQERMSPKEQDGEVTTFARRKPADGDISELVEIEKIYDYIRMLDCDGYPNAFIELAGCRLEFSQAELKDGKIDAHVRIVKK